MKTDAEQDPFFGVLENAPMTREEVAAGKAACRNQCPVRRECLKAALSGEEGWGTWGGYTAAERRRAKFLLGSNRAVMEAYDASVLDSVAVRRV